MANESRYAAKFTQRIVFLVLLIIIDNDFLNLPYVSGFPSAYESSQDRR